MKYAATIFFFSIALFFAPFAHAEYVLPYPSVMPGNKVYVLSRLSDRVKGYWSFGSIASSKYHMALSDKYLVQAKTLFEYKQYLLAFEALSRSDLEVASLPEHIKKGKDEHKDMSQIALMIKEEMLTHEGVLSRLKNDMPKTFLWTPEYKAATSLSIHEKIDQSVSLRKKIHDQVTL